MAKTKPQIKVDSIALDNTTWRRILDDVSVSVDPTGIKSMVCTFLVTGTTHADLLTNWNQTKTDFNKVNPRVEMWIDGTATTALEDMYPGDGTHASSLLTQVSQDPNAKQAGFTIKATFIAVTQVIEARGGSGRKNLPFTGMINNFAISSTYSAGRVQSRTVSGSFTTSNGAATGPFTIASAASGGTGKTVLTVTTAPPTFVEGMKAVITASTVAAYIGTWIVTAINVAAKTITLLLTFSATTTGSNTLTNPISGKTNYLAAYDSILNDYLLVGDDGARDATSGLALTGEVLNESTTNGDDVSFTLDAEWMELDPTSSVPSIRKWDYTIQTSYPEKWKEGETAPTLINVSGNIHIDKAALGSSMIHGLFSSIKSQIMTAVVAQTGVSTVRQLVEMVTSSPGSMIVQFGLQLSSFDTDLISYKSTTTITRKFKFTKWSDSDGYTIMQTPPEPWEVMVTLTVSRQGYDEVDLAALTKAPTAPGGYTMTMIGDTEIEDEPQVTVLNGEKIYDQTYSVSYMRDKFRSGGITQSRPVIT